jgi:hypothetical protein
MKRITTFLFGAIVGAGLFYAATTYHVVQAADGFHLIEKIDAGLEDPYVDIREFSLGDWADHQALALAITNAGKQHLLTEAAGNTVNQALEGLQQHFQQPQQ